MRKDAKSKEDLEVPRPEMLLAGWKGSRLSLSPASSRVCSLLSISAQSLVARNHTHLVLEKRSGIVSPGRLDLH